MSCMMRLSGEQDYLFGLNLGPRPDRLYLCTNLEPSLRSGNGICQILPAELREEREAEVRGGWPSRAEVEKG